MLKALINVLEADIPTINDLARLSKNDLPQDVIEFIRGWSIRSKGLITVLVLFVASMPLEFRPIIKEKEGVAEFFRKRR